MTKGKNSLFSGLSPPGDEGQVEKVPKVAANLSEKKHNGHHLSIDNGCKGGGRREYICDTLSMTRSAISRRMGANNVNYDKGAGG